MPITARAQYPNPDMWNTFGHSYLQFTGGSVDQTGRFDALFRASLDIEYTNWRNRAVSGAQLFVQGRKLGGFGRVFQESGKNTSRGGPYTADGGALLMCYGINDLGNNGTGPSTFAAAQTNFIHTMRSCISLWRAARVWDNTAASGISFGAGFTAGTGTADWSFGNSTHNAVSLTNANFTITLPSDYAGEPVAICFDGVSTNGGTVTWSGTAGVTGTTSVSGINHILFNHAKMVKRITNLTSANAGQTIVGTVTQLDSGGSVSFDAWWLEAKAAPPIIVCNVARLPAAGYALYAGWTGTESAKDAEVVALNNSIASLVAEFDSMVQVADIDAALNKTSAYFWDGLHPNELGAAKCADACMTALRRMSPTADGVAVNFNVPSPRQGSIVRPRIGGNYYTAEYRASGTNYTPVAGDVWAIPFSISQGRERYIRMCMRLAAGGSAQGSIRWGVYDDVGWTGYPQCLIQELTTAGALSLGTGTGQVQSPASPSAGSMNLTLDPGLYWLVIKCITAGTGQTWETLAGPMPFFLPNLGAAGARQTPAGWKLTGQGSTALSDVFPTGATLSDNAPLVGVQLF